MAKLIYIFTILFSSTTFSKDLFNYIYKDPGERVNKHFKIPKYFRNSTEFWFNIYTKYESKYNVIHDKNNLKIVYSVVKKKGRKNELKALRKSLISLGKGKSNYKANAKVLNALKKANIKIPKDSKSKKNFFKKLSKGLRSQTGQRNMIENGLFNIQIFKPFISSLFKQFKLPPELLAISFLESSFNPRARSKVGATGVWQFMRRVGRYFMTINKYVDGRNNPVISSFAALHLLKQNLQVLKSWDLAIPAYNSGTKHLLRAKRRMKKYKPSLQNILKHYKHPHLGFASKNFYSEFLALVHVLAYREKTFPIIKKNPVTKYININNFNVYLSKCSVRPKQFFKKLKKRSSNLKFLNSHIKKKSFNRFVPKGTIFVSDISLNPKKFYKVPLRKTIRSYPKNWRFHPKAKCN